MAKQITRAWIDQWTDAINGDAGCANSGRDFNDAFTLAMGEHRYTFKVSQGAVSEVVEDGGPLVRSRFTLIAEAPVWLDLFSPAPPPMNHAIFAAIAVGNMSFEGDIQLLFQQMTTFSMWIDVARRLNGPVELPPDPEWHDAWQSKGHYVNVTVDGCRHKVFYFEAGQGIPVLCQHTAGNENREWHHLLEDRELTKRFRFIAYDLPAHGKSDPPYDKDYFAEDHLLTSDWLTQFVVNFSSALQLDQPIFLGCSIGGVLALHLAERYPEHFRAVVGMAGAVPTYGFFHDWWINPEVNIGMMEAGMVDAVIPPVVSRWDRQINRMMQSAHPRSMRNDLHFWGVDNADAERVKRIDPSKVPIYMYAGEYDFTCPPAHVEASAKAIGDGVHYEMLEGFGHFPMSEDYARFRPILIRTLEDIIQRTQ